MKLKSVTILISFIIFNQAFSQDGTWSIYNTSNSSLAENTIYAITSAGDCIWFGTATKGLSCYQKSRDYWENYSTRNSRLSSNLIHALHFAFDYLWIGTDKGLSCFSPQTNQWKTIDSLHSVNSITADNAGIWYGTAENGIFSYDVLSEKIIGYSPQNSGLPSSKITSIRMEGQYVWLLTDVGIGYFDKSTEEWHALAESFGTYTLEVAGDYLWTGSITGAHRYNKLTQEWTDFPVVEIDTLGNEIRQTYYSVSEITANEQYVVLGTSKKGIRRYDTQTDSWEYFSMSNSGIAGDRVQALAFDGNDIWIGTWGKGACRYSNPVELWRTYRRRDSGLVDDIVRGMDVDSTKVWFSTYGKGACSYLKASRQWNQYTMSDSGLINNYIWSLTADKSYVWFFTLGNSLCRLHKETGKWQRIDYNATFKSSSVYSGDSDQKFTWFGSAAGAVTRFDLTSGTWENYDSTVTHLKSAVFSVKADKDKIWFGSQSSGVAYYDKIYQVWGQLNSQNTSLPDDYIMSIDVDGDSVWFGTSKGPIIYNQSTGFWSEVIPPDTLLTNRPVTCIGVQGDFVWLGTLSGLYRLQKSTQTWEIFYSYNSPLAANQIRLISVDGRYFWVSTYNTNRDTGGISRYADLRPPFVGHTPVSDNPLNAQPSNVPVTILAEINDEVAITRSELYYRHLPESTFQRTILTPEFRSISQAIIPAQAIEPGIMEYWIAVSDGINTATHPYSNARSHPHLFYVYDSVPPTISASIASATGFLIGGEKIQVNLKIDGTGSIPTLGDIFLFHYDDLNAEHILDSLKIDLLDSSITRDRNTLSVSGHFYLPALPQNVQGIRLQISAGDQGHNANGLPLTSNQSSNALIRSSGTLPTVQITEPDSFAVIGKVVKIIGTASSPSLKNYLLQYRDQQGNSGIISTAFQSKIDAPLGIWDTSLLSDGTVSIELIVENEEGLKNQQAIPVLLDNTPPHIQLENVTNNQLLSGSVGIVGTVADAHFKEYQFEYGLGVNPADWKPIDYARLIPMRQDTLIIWNTTELNGLYSLRIKAMDLAGNETIRVVLVQIDNREGTLLIKSPQPNAIIAGKIQISGTVNDENFAEFTLDFLAAGQSDSAHRIYSSQEPVTNGLLADWDTNGLNGVYLIRLMLKDQTGRQNVLTVPVVIDNQYPIARIDRPLSGEQEDDLIEIYGTATDEHLQNYFFEWSAGNNPVSWTPISKLRMTTPVDNDNLGQWSAASRTGEFSLRLSVMDVCGHISRDSVAFAIVPEINLMQGSWVYSEDGVVGLYLPPNSLSDHAQVTINLLPEQKLKPIREMKFLSSIYQIEPVEMNLKKPATLHFYLNKLAPMTSRTFSICAGSGSDTTLQVIGGTLNENEMITGIYQFGTFVLSDQTISGTGGESGELECQPRVFSPRNDSELNIIFQLNQGCEISGRVYNLAGRLVKSLVENRYLNGGQNVLRWNGRDWEERLCPNGLYLIVIKADDFSRSKTVMILDK